MVSSTPLDMQRFIGKRVFQSTPAQALQDVEAVLQRGVQEAEVYVAAAPSAADKNAQKAPKIVAVTACPTGVAHTFMAAEALQQAAKRLSYDLQVETQGSVGARNPLSAEAIRDADVNCCWRQISRYRPSVLPAKKSIVRHSVALKQAEATLNKALSEGQQESAAAAGGAPAKRRKDRCLQTPADGRVLYAADGGGGRFADRAVPSCLALKLIKSLARWRRR